MNKEIEISGKSKKRNQYLLIIFLLELAVVLICAVVVMVKKDQPGENGNDPLAQNGSISENGNGIEISVDAGGEGGNGSELGNEEGRSSEGEKEDVTTEEPTTEEPTTEDPEVVYERELAERAESIMSAMTEEEKIYQLFIVTQDQLTGVNGVTRSGDATREALEHQPVGGIVYFSENLAYRDQCMKMIEDIQSYSKYGLFISVDEEGGRVSRLGNNSAMGITAFSPMERIGDSGDVEKAYQVGATIGSEIKELGFNLDYAPDADVNSNPMNPVIADRAFSSDPAVAADMVAAAVRGFEDSGMICSLKHFPGHGDTETDSHYGAAESAKTIEELRECEFLPFQAGIQAGAPIVMVGHIGLPNVTGDSTPATLSHKIVTGLLREELGYEGLIITDSMSMQAITNQYSSEEAGVKALLAGIDIILMPEDLDKAVQGIQTALESGELTEDRIEDSVRRILMTKLRYGIIPLEEAVPEDMVLEHME